MDVLLGDFPVVIDQVVAWGEMDPFQHLNNVIYFRYFENVRVEYMRRLGWFEYQKETGIGPILASTQARYRRAVTYPDKLRVGARISAMGSDRFTMEYRIASTQQAEIVTTGEGIVVTYHYADGKKVPIPDLLRSRIEQIEAFTEPVA